MVATQSDARSVAAKARKENINMSYSKAGCENPATSATSPVIPNRQTRPGVQMPGTKTRKVPGGKAGNDVAGEANLVTITHGRHNLGKKTWKGSELGYTTRSLPDYKPSPAKDTFQDTKPYQIGSKPTNEGDYTGKNVHLNGSIKRGGGSVAQSVKGKNPPRTDGEAKPVAGTTR
jgi:hypothetical protein